MLSVTVWREIPVVAVICFLAMITFPDGVWLGSLSEMVQQSKLPLSYGKLFQFVWLSFFPWMSCIIFRHCDMLCCNISSAILPVLVILWDWNHKREKLLNCFSIARYSLPIITLSPHASGNAMKLTCMLCLYSNHKYLVAKTTIYIYTPFLWNKIAHEYAVI